MPLTQERFRLTAPEPRLVGFALRVAQTGVDIPKLIIRVLGLGWIIRGFGNDGQNFDVTSKEHSLDVANAWEKTYRLRSTPGIAYAEPQFELSLSGREDWNEVGDDLLESDRIPTCGEEPHLEQSADPEWPLIMTGVLEAWQAHFPGGERPGGGVIVGHPDTGYRLHQEIVENLLIERGFDFYRDDPNAEDELEEGVLKFPGHGTGTASVIVSRRGAQGIYSSGKFVTGVAPGATIIPLRVAPTVVLLNMLALSQAIEYAANNGAHVISISMGGLGSWRLSEAVLYAVNRGVIICAAAGNCVPFVVFPAAYSDVVGVAACNAKKDIWRGSSRGSAVDITAPGESIWRADVERAPDGNPVDVVERGSGTSYAVAHTAGAAALWLARHSRDRLLSMYGAEKLPAIFRRLVRETATMVSGWPTNRFGAGLINIRALLDAALPAPDDLLEAAFIDYAEAVVAGTGGMTTFAHLIEGARPQGPPAAAGRDLPLLKTLADIFSISEEEVPRCLRQVGQELAFHIATDPDLLDRFARQVSAADRADAVEVTNGTLPVRAELITRPVSATLRNRIASPAGNAGGP
jgi:serine protease